MMGEPVVVDLVREFELAKDIMRIAKVFPDDLPDGMADGIIEEWQMYKETGKNGDDKEAFILGIKEICTDYAFPFG